LYLSVPFVLLSLLTADINIRFILVCFKNFSFFIVAFGELSNHVTSGYVIILANRDAQKSP
jgi:hypothetical protein